MKFKNQIRRLFNKKAGASVGVAIKVLTSVVLGAAMLAGTYGIVKTNVVPTAENKVSSMFEATDTIGLSGGGSGGVVVPDPVVELKRNGTIPEGATYGKNAVVCDNCYQGYGISGMRCSNCGYLFDGGTLLTAGEAFPGTPSRNDIYIEGDYRYQYTSQGWNVKAQANKASYGDIISEIAGKPITDMTSTFKDCNLLTTVPVIPSSVTHINYAFLNCTSLTTAPIIPNSVMYMGNAFEGCSALVTAPVIPDSVQNMDEAFRSCTNLTTVPTIPNGITSLEKTFLYCPSLTTVPTIPDSVTNMLATFQGCSSLTTAPVIPSRVTNIVDVFSGCTSLTATPIIPSSVIYMDSAFYDCTSLTGTIEVNANPTSYDDCLGNTQIAGITGSCSQETKDALIATK